MNHISFNGIHLIKWARDLIVFGSQISAFAELHSNMAQATIEEIEEKEVFDA
jgi:hypothetical protein